MQLTLIIFPSLSVLSLIAIVLSIYFKLLFLFNLYVKSFLTRRGKILTRYFFKIKSPLLIRLCLKFFFCFF